MYWIALWPSHDDERTAWGWRALHYTPRVATVDEALLLEVSATERLWGGRRRLLQGLLDVGEALSPAAWASGPTALVALALMRLKRRGDKKPKDIPGGLPVDVLTAAMPHAGLLERIGCRTWGQLRALPRAGLTRRFGAALVDALDRAHGDKPDTHEWLQLPEHFDLKLELVSLATTAPELMWAGQRLLSQLQVWLAARNRGVLALELEWTLDLRRLDGKVLPPTQSLEVRTAQPTQDMAHLRRLVTEHLSRATIAAPANHLRLRSLETVPWGGIATSLLPEDNKPGEKLHAFVERLSVRLGEGNVLVGEACSDHRPERMQAWRPAREVSRALSSRHESSSRRRPGSLAMEPAPRRPRPTTPASAGVTTTDPLYPTWLLPEPVLLEMRGNQAWYGRGPVLRLARLYRIENAWWEEGGPACRDYFIARSEEAGLMWIYRERPRRGSAARWYLQGLYA